MKKTLVLCLITFCFAFAAKQSIVVLPCTGDFNAKELERLRDKVEEVTRNVLPSSDFRVIPYKDVREQVGDEALYNACEEGGQCFGQLAAQVNADYGAWCMVNKYKGKWFGSKLALKFQLYSVGEKDLLFTKEYDSYKPKDYDDLVEIIKKEIPGALKEKILRKKQPPPEAEKEKLYVVNLSTEPPGAFISFDGVPATSCPKTPCKAELRGGNVRIIATLEQYEKADTTISIKQNNQSVAIKLKSNEKVKLTYSGFSASKTVQKEPKENNSEMEALYNASRSEYVRGDRAVAYNGFKQIYESVKTGELAENSLYWMAMCMLDAGKKENAEILFKTLLEKFPQGAKVCPTEFNLAVMAAEAKDKAKQIAWLQKLLNTAHCVSSNEFHRAVDILKELQKELKGQSYTESSSPQPRGGGNSFTDSRDNKTYRVVKIGNQTWMAENLNYNASGSKCYDNQESNCKKYGRLYDWNTAITACPKGWHLPTEKEYGELDNFVGGWNTAGKFLKAMSGWNNNGNGEDKFGFSALPGGGSSGGDFSTVGNYGYWWSARESYSGSAYSRDVYYHDEYVLYDSKDKSYLLSVRCLQD
ncbi:MAG: PEGA domain-containing protein [Fibromonadaceae bacterium]|jgi:uncharacterized protein (TIGR02145 family)|nr:PEGA domain-containing protein [Fibromonadaceae bacterium]